MSQNVIYKDIMRNYEKLRDEALAGKLLREKEIEKKLPEIKNIERQIASQGIKMVKAAMSKPQDAKKLSEEIKNEIEILKEKKADILKENGYPADYLEIKYVCPICEDTGYVGSKKCGCFSQMLVNAVYGRSGVGQGYEKVSLKDFDLDFYSDEIWPEAGISPKENMKEILGVVQDFLAGFGKEFRNLFFYGGTGLGKTFLCNAIAKELLDEGKFVIYVTASQLFKLIEEDRFSRTDEEEPSRLFDDILNAQLLIIDDLGSEFSTILSASEAFNIINTRLIDKRPVVISTNLDIKDLANNYSDRIISRIWGSYDILEFFGEDIRLKKKFSEY